MNTNVIGQNIKKDLAEGADLNNLTDEQRQKLDELSGILLQRVFTRIGYALTDEDMKKIEEMDKDDVSGQAVRYFIISKVANFDAIIEEETRKLKEMVS